jgi:hypothetical protein
MGQLGFFTPGAADPAANLPTGQSSNQYGFSMAADVRHVLRTPYARIWNIWPPLKSGESSF